MNTDQAIAFGVEKLKNTKINSASLDAEILLSFVLKKSKEFIYTHPEKTVNSQQLVKFKKYISRRATGEPVAYITGHKEFYGLDFLVNKNVLIPRPETELLVESVLEQIRNDKIINFSLIDVGTGSGCIPIVLAKNLYNVKCIKYYGIDNSIKALTVARQNAKIHHLDKKIRYIQNDLLNNIHQSKIINLKSKMIITANLPYLSAKLYRQNYKNLKYEPKAALLAGYDGFKYYRQLLNQIHSLITHPSLLITCFFEIDPSQTSSIKKLIRQYFSKAKITVKKNLAGLNRLVVVKLSQKH